MKKISITRSLLVIALSFVPVLSFAVGPDISGGITTLSSLVTKITETLVKALATLLLSAALLAFFYGVVQYIWGAREGKTDAIKNGNMFMKWSVLALFVMFSIYGIIQFAQGTLGMTGFVESIRIPDINFRSSGTGAGTGNSGTLSPGSSNNQVSPTQGTGNQGSLNPTFVPAQQAAVNNSQATTYSSSGSSNASLGGSCNNSNVRCGSGLTCINNTCLCADDTGCPNGSFCNNNSCISGNATQGGYNPNASFSSGSSCSGNTGGVSCGCTADCNAPFVCSAGQCVPLD